MSLLITGGTGFIGSHTVVELLALDKDIVIVDNLSNSSTLVLDRIKQITGKSVTFIQADICDHQALTNVFQQHNIEAVVHFAGLKAVGESSEIPLSYYHNNVSGSVTLLQVMSEQNVNVSQVAVGRVAQLQIFGDDYPTTDGTGVRDYIHVVDLAQGHVKALEKLSEIKGCVPINLGTGNGTSVLEIVNTFKEISGQDIPYNIAPRRAGDIATVYADANVANTLLNWHAKRDLATMITDTWRWQSQNPNGFE